MTKEHLQSYQYIKKEQREIEQRLRNLERSPESEQEILRPLQEHYKKKREELVAAQLEIERAIETLDSVERDVLRLRYIDGLSWYKVTTRIHYSESHARRIHVRALAKLEKL